MPLKIERIGRISISAKSTNVSQLPFPSVESVFDRHMGIFEIICTFKQVNGQATVKTPEQNTGKVDITVHQVITHIKPRRTYDKFLLPSPRKVFVCRVQRKSAPAHQTPREY
jgi:hypothetical protein